MAWFSKKRLNEIVNMIGEYIDDSLEEEHRNIVLDEIKGRICDIMNFDENKKTYTPERGQKMIASYRKLAESRGVTLYEVIGNKKRYEQKKALKQLQNADQ